MRMVSDTTNSVTASRSYFLDPVAYLSHFDRVHVQSEWEPLKAALAAFNPHWPELGDYSTSLYSELAREPMAVQSKRADEHGKLLDLLHEKGVKLFVVTPDTKTDANCS